MHASPRRRALCAILFLLLLSLALVACGQSDGGETTPQAGETDSTTAPAATSRVTRTTAPPTTAERPSPTPEYYTVTFDPSNGQPLFTKRVVNDRLPVSLPKNPVLSGKVFVGWYLDAPHYKRPYRGEMIVADTLLTARYAAVAYTVTFHPGDGAKASFTETLVPGGAPVPDYPSVTKKNAAVSGWYYDEEYTRPYRGEPITENTHLYADFEDYTLTVPTVLPALHITTKGGAAITSTETYVGATVTLTGADTGDSLYAAAAEIRGRGNSTWRFFDKKPYRLKLGEKADLLGLGANRDFVLLANAADPTMLHNYTLFTLAGLLGDEVTSKCRFVSVWLNGSYEGVYLLCEQTEAGKTRVPIDDGKSGKAEAGFLVEFGGNAADGVKYTFTLDAVKKGAVTYQWREGFRGAVKSPDTDVLTSLQKAYIKRYTNQVNTAIFKGDWEAFLSLCDLDSFVNGFIANMVVMNGDMDFNFHFYKPQGGKLHYGPLWDADQACGTSRKNTTLHEGWYVSRYEHWLTALWRIPEFRMAVADKWAAHREVLLAFPTHLVDMATYLEGDITRNYLRHDVLGKPYWRQCEEHLSYTTYEEHFDFFIDWMTKRIAWIDSQLP